MNASRLQRLSAQCALFFLPFTAVNFGVAFTFGDFFLVLAICLNLPVVFSFQRFQIPLLAGAVLFALATLVDVDTNLQRVLQTIYIWGLVVPFGWCAFTTLPLRRMALILIAAAGVSSIVAIGQGAGIIGAFENQDVISVSSTGFARAAGLSLQPNELAAFLVPVLALTVFLSNLGRFAITGIILGGVTATISKGAIMAILPLGTWLHQDFLRKLRAKTLFLALGFFVLAYLMRGLYLPTWEHFVGAVEHRASYFYESVSERYSLIQEAMDLARDCVLLGYGVEGASALMIDRTGHNVHVFFLGLFLIGGAPATIFLSAGFFGMATSVWRMRCLPVFIMLLTHFGILMTHTVMLLSAQSIPLMIAGAVIAQHSWASSRVSVPSGHRQVGLKGAVPC